MGLEGEEEELARGPFYIFYSLFENSKPKTYLLGGL